MSINNLEMDLSYTYPHMFLLQTYTGNLQGANIFKRAFDPGSDVL